MRLAWFRQHPLSNSTPFDDTAHAIIELGHTHEVDVYTPENINDFPVAHARALYDLPVYELPPRPWRSFARVVEERYPGLSMRVADRPVGWGAEPNQTPTRRTRTTSTLLCGVIGQRPQDSAPVALRKARELGAPIDIFTADPAEVIDRADIVLALGNPSDGEPVTPALAALAAKLPVVIVDVEATALWPSLDPQTWRARGPAASGEPAVISLDLRDEEHSLLLALRRLSTDAPFREQLADSGFKWWRGHATLRHAVQGWERVIAAAASSHT